jgi:hypothetical protein
MIILLYVFAAAWAAWVICLCHGRFLWLRKLRKPKTSISVDASGLQKGLTEARGRMINCILASHAERLRALAARVEKLERYAAGHPAPKPKLVPLNIGKSRYWMSKSEIETVMKTCQQFHAEHQGNVS